MSQHSLRVAEAATKDKELLGSTNQEDASRQVKEIKEQLKEVDATQERAEEAHKAELKEARKDNKKKVQVAKTTGKGNK